MPCTHNCQQGRNCTCTPPQPPAQSCCTCTKTADLHKARHYLDKLLEVEQASCAAESGINPENPDARIVAGMAGALQDLTRPGESQSATSTSQPNQKHEL